MEAGAINETWLVYSMGMWNGFSSPPIAGSQEATPLLIRVSMPLTDWSVE